MEAFKARSFQLLPRRCWHRFIGLLGPCATSRCIDRIWPRATTPCVRYGWQRWPVSYRSCCTRNNCFLLQTSRNGSYDNDAFRASRNKCCCSWMLVSFPCIMKHDALGPLLIRVSKQSPSLKVELPGINLLLHGLLMFAGGKYLLLACFALKNGTTKSHLHSFQISSVWPVTQTRDTTGQPGCLENGTGKTRKRSGWSHEAVVFGSQRECCPCRNPEVHSLFRVIPTSLWLLQL